MIIAPKPKKLCSKEKIGRILVGFGLILIAWLVISNFIQWTILLVGVYLIITGLIGSCFIYAIFKN
jgi:hypothetical protein